MAAAATVPDSERLASLEHEVHSLRAQLESERINAEQASLAIEERYSKLADEYGAACSARETAQAELETVRSELAESKKSFHAQDVRSIELEKEIERKKVEVRELHTDKRSILQLLDQRKREVEEKNETIKTYLDKVVAVTSEKSELDSQLREFQQGQNRFEAMQARLNQENALLKQHGEWLNEELTVKSKVLLEDRKKASEEIVNLKTKVVDLESSLEERKRSLGATEKQLEGQQTKLAESEEQCMQLKQKLATQEALFEKEVGTAKRLIHLYQDSADKGSGKVKELEGIIEELQKHMQENTKACDEKVAKAEEKVKEAEARANESKKQLERTMELASQGMTPSRVNQIRKAGDSAVQVLELSPAAAAATMLKEGMSLTDMYTKYAEMSDAWRQERNEKKKIQGYLDTILDELERKAPLINEQKAEYERLMDSHDALTKRLEDAISERHTLESTMAKARSDVQRATRERVAMEQQAEDLSRQVQVLLKEVEDMKSGRAMLGDAPKATSTSANGVVGASNVITDHLVEFKNIQELQEQNKRLLAVSRQLGDDNEQKLSDLKEELEAKHMKQVEKYKSELDNLNAQRQQHESLMQQIVRQRDLYKSLAPERDSDKSTGANVKSPGVKLTDAIQDHKTMYVDLQKDYEKYKTENTKNLQMLRDEVFKYREEAGIARGEKAQIHAQMEFERERLARLNEICNSQAKEIEAFVQKNANLVQKNTQYEQKVKDVTFDLDVSKDDLRREAERNVSLQAEKELLAKSESRLSSEVAAAVAEKHRQQASMESLIQRYGEQEKTWIKERDRILEENKKMQENWAEAQKQLLEESNRSVVALSASTNLAADTAARIATLEVELKNVTKDKDDFQRKLNSAKSKAESLQTSLQKAEEKAALAVMRSTRVAQEATQNITTSTGNESDVISKLKAQLQVAQNDASNAQEAAAAAAGHLAQFKAMCAASDEALKAMKEAHEGYKQEAASAADSAQKEMDIVKQKLSEAEAEVAKKRGIDAEEEKKRLAQEEVLISENSKLKEESGTLKKQLELNEEKVSTLEKDVKEYHQQWRSAKSLYDNELIAHASDVKRLSSAEEEIEKAQKDFQNIKEEYNKCRIALKEAESKLQSEKVSLQADASSLQSKLEELKKQNSILHDQLNKMTTGSTEDQMQLEESAGAEIQQVIQYLRKEKETTDCQLSLFQQENVRLRKQLEHALKRADESTSRLEMELKKSQEKSNIEEKHSKLLEKVEQLNLLRESNAGLRDENGKLQGEIKILRSEKGELGSTVIPLKEKINEMQALLDSKDDEVKSIKEQSSRWETRTQNLLDKYGQVDLGEYERVCKALKEAEKAKSETNSQVEEAVKKASSELEKTISEMKEDLAKAKNQEAIAKKQIFNVFNPTRLPVAKWIAERDAKNKKIENLEKKVEGMSSDVTSNAAQSSKLLDEEKAKSKAYEEAIDSYKEKERALQNQLEEMNKAKSNLQVKVVNKLKQAKELKISLTQKVKDLEKKLKLKQKELDAVRQANAEEPAKTPVAEPTFPVKTTTTTEKVMTDSAEIQEQKLIGTKRTMVMDSPGEVPKKRSKSFKKEAAEEPEPEAEPEEEEEQPEEEVKEEEGEEEEEEEEAVKEEEVKEEESAKPQATGDMEPNEEEVKVEGDVTPEEGGAPEAVEEDGEIVATDEPKEDANEDPKEETEVEEEEEKEKVGMPSTTSLNALAQPFTPTRAVTPSVTEEVADPEAGQEETEAEAEDQDEDVSEGELEAGEEAREEMEIEEEKESELEQEEEMGEDKNEEDDAKQTEEQQEGKAGTSRRAAITWKGGKKSRLAGKGQPVVSKDPVKMAKKAVAAATRGVKIATRGKKIAKKSPGAKVTKAAKTIKKKKDGPGKKGGGNKE